MSEDNSKPHESEPNLFKEDFQKLRKFISIEITKPIWRGFVFGITTVLSAFTLSQIMKFDREQLKLYIFAQLFNCLPIA